MSALLDTNPHADILSQDQVMYIQIAHNVVRPVPRRKSPQVLDISQWVMAFHLYIAIYTKAHPHEAPNLLQYLMVVESITEEKGDWRVYDETFRFKRAESKTPWEKLDNELYTYVRRKAQLHLSVDQVPSSNPMPLTAESSSFPLNDNQYLASLNSNGGSNPNAQPNSPVIGWPFRHQRWFVPGSTPGILYPNNSGQQAHLVGSTTFPQPVQSFPVQSNSFRHPKGTCWNFRDGKFCDRSCGFTHECGHYGGSHPSVKCWNGQARTAKSQDSSKTSTTQAPYTSNTSNTRFPKGSSTKARSGLFQQC